MSIEGGDYNILQEPVMSQPDPYSVKDGIPKVDAVSTESDTSSDYTTKKQQEWAMHFDALFPEVEVPPVLTDEQVTELENQEKNRVHNK